MFAILAQKGLDFSSNYYVNLFSKINSEKDSLCENKDIECSSCMKGLEEDKILRGPGFIKIKTNDGKDKYLCHICYKRF